MPWSQKTDFQTEILSYCRSDVDILRLACLRFRKMFIEITAKEGTSGIYPFESCITIASACNLVFRTNFLESESIGIIPPHGYRPQQNRSRKAIQWIRCISQRENINIQHALNGGEKQIGSKFCWRIHCIAKRSAYSIWISWLFLARMPQMFFKEYKESRQRFINVRSASTNSR